jgi:hypothetical protein
MERASGCVGTMARILAYFLVFLLVIIVPISLLASNTLRVWFSSNTFSDVVASFLVIGGGVREQLVDQLISNTWSSQNTSGRSEALDYLNSQDRAEIAKILFPDDWVKSQIQSSVDTFMTWVESEETMPKLVLDLQPIRDQFQEGGSYRITELIVGSWPQCNSDQLQQMDHDLQQDPPVLSELCKSEGDLLDRLIEFVNRTLLKQVKNLPTEVPLLNDLSQQENTFRVEELRKNILSLLFVLKCARLVPIFLFGLIMTLVVRSWRDLGRWWGIPLVVGALIGILIVLAGHAFGPGIIENAFTQVEQPPEVMDPFMDALWALVAPILNRTALHAFLGLALGTVLFVMTNIVRRRTKEAVLQPVKTPERQGEKAHHPPPPEVEHFDPDGLVSDDKGDTTPKKFG